MDKALMRQLSQITQEEQQILAGRGIDMAVYGGAPGTVKGEHMLAGKRIDIRAHTRFAVFPRHRHDFVEMMYVCTGSVTHRLGAREITVNAGELLFLGRNTYHEILPAGEGDIAVNFIVKPSFFSTAFDMMDEQNVLSEFIITSLAGEGAADEYLHFPATHVLPVQNLVENLVWALCHAHVAETSEKINEVTMGLLCLQLLRMAHDAATGGGAPRSLALCALQYIDAHCADATLRQFAQENRLTEYTASRIIKAQLGTNFRALLMEKRFASALRLLRTTVLPVSAVIAQVGYENTSYFYRTFAARYGCTPQEYREKKAESNK